MHDKYLAMTFRYLMIGAKNESLMEWLNSNKKLEIVSIMSDANTYTVVYINPDWIRAERAADNM